MNLRINKTGFGIPPPFVGRLVLFEASYLLAYRFGMSFTQDLGAPFWFPDSVLLAALLLSPPATWWIYILGTLPIRLFLFVPPATPFWFLLACFANDALKSVIAAWLLRPASRQWAWFDKLREFTRYLLVAVLFVPMLSALAGAATRVGLGFAFWPAWRSWFFGDALASLLLTPFLMCLMRDYRHLELLKRSRYVEALVITAGLIVTALLAFHGGFERLGQPPFLLYLPIPFLLWAAISFGTLGASSALFLVSSLAIVETLAGRGPFHLGSADSSLLSIQLFLFFVSFPFLFLSVIIHQQRKAESALRESEERFRSLANTAPVMVWLAGTDGLCTFFNQPWLQFTGRSMEEELGNGWMQRVHPEDREVCHSHYLSALAVRNIFTCEYRLMRRDGVYRWVLDSGVPRYEPDGEFIGYVGSCIDLTDRKEAEVKLREMSVRLLHSQEAERFRIGQQLHDDLAQRVVAVSMGLTQLERRFPLDEETRRDFRKLHEQTLDVCKEIAHVSHQLRPITLERLGLPLALRSLCAQATTGKRRVLFIQQKDVPAMAESASASLYRIAQEALRNALTHSGASNIDVELSASESAVRVSVRDEGCGFVVESATKTSLGLSGMAERMKNAGGDFAVRSSPGRGTIVTATIPTVKALTH